MTLNDPERALKRDVLIYMNHPLRYRGETFYQAGFKQDDRASILEVVRNPSFIAPYVACVCRRRVTRSIRLPSRRLCAAKKNGARMKRYFPAILLSSRSSGRHRAGFHRERARRFRPREVRQDSRARRRPG